WPVAPARPLIFARDIPQAPHPLPRYLPPDADRRLLAALEELSTSGSSALATERMVPLDHETLIVLDRIAARRTPGRALPHPRTARPTEFLLVHQGRRVSFQALREQLDRAARADGLGKITPHALRHTYATALVNAGASLQALMQLLGHVSAAMSLRYGRLFDTTVRAEYERALTQAKAALAATPPAGPPATGPTVIGAPLSLADIT